MSQVLCPIIPNHFQIIFYLTQVAAMNWFRYAVTFFIEDDAPKLWERWYEEVK